ncbi:ABC transporter permease [Mangrovihabitans endophyticus]|uniref:Nitrate ABC transporter permease n=1 Tax=Mangrovihabitans endophyticus TaxID=1751298 RepID=A0A8J3FNZ6_9ACTN|nr:ABC transporter permease [Mangrovihabitans endophyticus]GGK91630.1 nitrate ABC transporter permease [Mangrovihabitans endophyticus]
MSVASAASRPALAAGRLAAVVARRWAVAVALVAAWEIVTRRRGDVFFPPPSAIVARMHELWFSGPATRLWLTPAATADLLPSLGRMAAGLAGALLAGVTLGVALGRSPRTLAYLDPLLQFGRSVPPPTLVPVFVVLLHLGTTMQVTSIVSGAVWPILLNAADGARSVDPVQTDTARVFGLSATDRLRTIILPSALPKIFAGLRLSLSLALILMVFSEMLPGTANGIGFQLIDAQSRSDLPTTWAAVALLGILGYLLNTLLLGVERRALRGHDATRGGERP